ncbi:MAG: prolipoprotein diacylglyceryl transferase [Gammaproteobacteria bacterium]|nr:prolipoprotein diacylglyceryl transferase [Gammaproteobacteria bacterium]NIR82000.1 prolipoprotein diacylglyceryl transferase [Gammaproteobacteria bacterium]NIR89060.1 prolipoprotein diacylglyceryl transferase [Gammaproteobacteria bacterium]NIU03107.1 prolipoprotein diacylglyceryl transferase [Gammaproteobacteria bacterium]NIX84382.1 prolipoprotein diacylglyceryl transferase [Gammaproteobacteria bacterium]
MLPYPDIDPVAFRIGPVQVHWYGIMYLLGFLTGWWLGRVRAKQPQWSWKPTDVDDLLFYIALGVIVGGRLGYVFFYDFASFTRAPWSVFAIWQGGMSFHGGLLGAIVALWMYARRRGSGFFTVTDFTVPLIPAGLGFGRIGNFINGELWGVPTELPWGMVFPDPRAGGVPRHPSPLYEALLEGVVLFVILWLYSRRPRPTMAVSGAFLLGYGVFRFGVEFVRAPDSHIGYLAFGWLTMGQVLTAPMMLLGLGLLWYAYRRGSPGRTQSVGAGSHHRKRRART